MERSGYIGLAFMRLAGRVSVAAAIVTALSAGVHGCRTPGNGKMPAAGEASGAGETHAAADGAGGAAPTQQSTPLPAPFLGSFSFVKHWSPGFDVPNSYGNATFTKDSFTISEGETSKDSGHWTIQGSYTVKGGSGTIDSPFVIDMLVVKGGGDGSIGYPDEAGPARDGVRIEGTLSLEGDTLHISMPKYSLDLERNKPQ